MFPRATAQVTHGPVAASERSGQAQRGLGKDPRTTSDVGQPPTEEGTTVGGRNAFHPIFAVDGGTPAMGTQAEIATPGAGWPPPRANDERGQCRTDDTQGRETPGGAGRVSHPQAPTHTTFSIPTHIQSRIDHGPPRSSKGGSERKQSPGEGLIGSELLSVV